MLSSKSYFFRAIYEWIVDSNCTPHIVVNAMLPDVDVPQQHVKNGQIVLNISPSAVKEFFMDRESVSFSARFSGQSVSIFVPMSAVSGIYARENGQGMIFESEVVPDPDNLPPSTPDRKSRSAKPTLRVVK